MTENELRLKFEDAIKGRSDLKGFWHSKAGKEIRTLIRTTDFNNFSKEQEKVWALVNKEYEPPKCAICDNKASFYQYSYLETCGVNCGAVLAQRNTPEDVKAAAQLVRVQASKSAASIAKRRSTMRDTLHSRGEEITASKQTTCMEVYGVKSVLQDPGVRSKIAATNKERYGSAHAITHPDIMAKRVETARALYERDVLPGRLIECQEAGYTAQFSTWVSANTFYPWKHDTCGHEFLHKLSNGCVPSCPKCRPRSRPEQFVVDYVASLGFDIRHNDRSLIKPYELDILVPSKSLAIEVNGLYWHHDETHAKPLLEKTQLVEAQNHQVLHFWDFEIHDKPDIVKSIIASKLGVLQHRIGSRQCELRDVPTRDAKEFLESNHLSGYANSKLKLGLYFKNELVCVATFAKPRFSKEDAIELVRFSTKRGHHVHGALSRLVKHASLHFNLPIVSFADRRISNGHGYESAGFELVDITTPNYWYVKGAARLPRYSCMKHKLPELLGESFDINLSEKENMLKAGWLIMKDAGNLKFKWSGIKHC